MKVSIVIAALASLLVLVSGQYREHWILYWVLMALCFLVFSGMVLAEPQTTLLDKNGKVYYHMAGGVGCLSSVSIILFLWLAVVVWF